MSAETRTVTIPTTDGRKNTQGMTVTLPWRCIHCNEPRGEPRTAKHKDGTTTNVWRNPCGHPETFRQIRAWIAKHVHAQKEQA